MSTSAGGALLRGSAAARARTPVSADPPTKRRLNNLDEGDARDDDAAQAPAAPVGSVLERLGALLQSQEVQLVMVVVIVVDLLCALCLVYAEARSWASPMITTLAIASGLALLLSALELGLVLAAFRADTFSQLGYTLDLVLVSLMLHATATGAAWATGAHLLNAPRLWRAARMMSVALQNSERDADALRAQLAAASKRAAAQALRLRRADEAVAAEAAKVRRLEAGFRAQREETDMLREALQIAAQTMASARGLDGFAETLAAEARLLGPLATVPEAAAEGSSAAGEDTRAGAEYNDDDDEEDDDEEDDEDAYEDPESGPETDGAQSTESAGDNNKSRDQFARRDRDPAATRKARVADKDADSEERARAEVSPGLSRGALSANLKRPALPTAAASTSNGSLRSGSTGSSSSSNGSSSASASAASSDA